MWRSLHLLRLVWTLGLLEWLYENRPWLGVAVCTPRMWIFCLLPISFSWSAWAQVHAAPGMDLSGAERLYNPYEGLSTALDARAGLPRNLYRLPEQPEFLFSEEASVHKRSWSENLTYYTGLGYLSGMVHHYCWQFFSAY